MAYVIKPSTFSHGYSIFRVEIVDGVKVERYIADATSLNEARLLCPNATFIACSIEGMAGQPGKYSAAI